MLDQVGQEVGPHIVGDDVAEGIGLGLQHAVLPILDGVVPGGDGVQHDLVANAQLLAEGHPGVKMGVVIGHHAVFLLPTDHGGVVDGVLAVGLAGPGLLLDGGGDGMTADGLVDLHARAQDVQMLVGKGLHAIVFGAGVGILPQLHIEGIGILGGVGQDGILDLQAIGEGHGILQAVGGDGQGALIGAGLGVPGNGDLHPNALDGVVAQIHGLGGPQDIGALGTVGAVGVGIAAPDVALVIGLGGADEGGGDGVGGDGVLAADEITGGDGDILQGAVHAHQSQLGGGDVIAPCGQLSGHAAQGLDLVIAVLGPLGIDVHDGTGHTQDGGGDGDGDLGAQAGIGGGQGDDGIALTHAGDEAGVADGGNGLVGGGVDGVIKLCVAGGQGVAKLPGGTLSHGDGIVLHGDAFCLVRLVVDIDLGGIDVVSAAGAVLAGGDSLEHMLALGQAVDLGDEQGVGVVALVQAELAYIFIIDVVGNIAHGPVLACVDVDGMTDEVDGVPDGCRVGSGVAGPGMVGVAAVPAGLGEGEVVALTFGLCVCDSGDLFRCVDAGDGIRSDQSQHQDQTKDPCEFTVFHRIPPSFFDLLPRASDLPHRSKIYVKYNKSTPLVKNFL